MRVVGFRCGDPLDLPGFFEEQFLEWVGTNDVDSRKRAVGLVPAIEADEGNAWTCRSHPEQTNLACFIQHHHFLHLACFPRHLVSSGLGFLGSVWEKLRRTHTVHEAFSAVCVLCVQRHTSAQQPRAAGFIVVVSELVQPSA